MDWQFLSTSGKHSVSTPTLMLEPDSANGNGNGNGGASLKWSKAPPITGGQTCFRLLCHSSRIGGVIGKSGSIIKHLQQSTSSKIKVEDSNSPPTSDDRVITIVASNSLNKNITFSHSTDEVQVQVSSAQEALLRVFERILDVAAEADEGLSLSLDSGSLVSCRMIVEKTQAGSVIGKGGKVVEKIRRETGTKIRVLALDNKLPSTSGVLPGEEIIEIEGDILAVKKALVAVSRCLQDSPPVDKTRVIISRPHEAVSQETLLTSSVGHPSGAQPLSLETGRVHTMESRTQLSPQQEVVFRILCSSDRVGGVIGKGGTIVRAIQNDTGASIIVGPSVDECDERLITITAVENPESQYSPALNAVVLVFNRSVEAGIEKGSDFGSKGSSVSARLVVSSNQVGCLLGKGGAIVSEMRKVTRTGIRITGGNEIAKCVPENDQVVQIVGQFVNVQDALYKVGCRLRENLLPSKMLNGVGIRGSSSLITDPNPYDRARNRHSLGLQSSDLSHGLNRHPTLSQSMERLGLSHNLDNPSPSLRTSKKAAGPNPRSSSDVGRESTSVQNVLELGSGNRSAFVTNTTVEIIVPEHVIGSVYGENGSNLTRLRQISGAKVEVNEPRPGTSDRVVVISGSSDETQAAQSLFHAFILTGSS